MNTENLTSALLASLLLSAVACGSSSSDGSATPGGEQDIVGSGGSDGTTCAPMTTLTCAPGYEASTLGCSSPRFAGAPTYARCISSAGKAVVATWTNATADPDTLLFYTITFDAGGTYDATGGCRPDPAGPSCFAITHARGNWSVQKSGPQLGAPAGADQLVLVDQLGQKSAYFFSVDAAQEKLSLSTAYDGPASVFTKQ